jgi:hypothetical protein
MNLMTDQVRLMPDVQTKKAWSTDLFLKSEKYFVQILFIMDP